MSWREAAACRGTFDPVFFPSKGGQREHHKAVAICATCAVSAECLDYALKTSQYYGIWSGTTLTERRKIKKKRRAA